MSDASLIGFLKSLNRNVRYLLLGVLIFQFGYFIQAYIIVYMLSKGFSSSQAGWSLALLCGASILGAIVGSNVGMKFSSKANIILSSTGLSLFAALIPFVVSIEYSPIIWGPVIFLAGFFSQMYRPSASVILSENLSADVQIMGFSLFRIALNAGGALGPLMATWLARYDWHYVFLMNSLCSLTFAVTIFFFVNDVKKNQSSDSTEGVEAGWATIIKDKKYWYFLIAMFLSSIAYIQIYSSVPVALESKGFPLDSYSKILITYSVILILFELQISSFVRKYPSWIPALLGTFVLCVGVASFGITVNYGNSIILSSVIMVAGLMVSGPTMFAYPATFPLAVRGKYIAANQISFTLGNALGPVIGMYFLSFYANLIWWCCFVIAIVCCGLLYVGMKPAADKTIKAIRSSEPKEKSV